MFISKKITKIPFTNFDIFKKKNTSYNALFSFHEKHTFVQNDMVSPKVAKKATMIFWVRVIFYITYLGMGTLVKVS